MGISTLESAVIAAITALIVAVITFIGAGENARRSSVRSLIVDDIQKLGNLLYKMVAISKKIVDANSGEARARWRKESYDCRNEINELRGRVRYSLWGIDDGLKALRSSSFYAEHYINDRKKAYNIIKKCTKLREALDRTIVDAFHMGRPPTFLQRQVIHFRAWHLKRCFDGSEPSTNPDDISVRDRKK